MPFDPELLSRLDSLAFSNAMVRQGKADQDRVVLAANVNEEGVVEADRPSVRFRLEPVERQGDTWTLLGAIDDAAAGLRFLVDLELDGHESLEDQELDPQDAPGFSLIFRRHPAQARGEPARAACAASWRMPLDEASFAAGASGEVEAGALVMGARLSRGPGSYGAPGSGGWYLLKCDRPGPFFIGFDRATGEAEMFPRRFDQNGSRFALQVLRAIT